MNVIAKLSPNRPSLTLSDLVKPNPSKKAERAIKTALKKAKKDQDAVSMKAKKLKD